MSAAIYSNQRKSAWCLGLVLVVLGQMALAGDVRIGAVKKNGMEVAAVYLQPVTMAPMLPGTNAPSDIHLEADIHALAANPQGFREGDWVPYLRIAYQLEKPGSKWNKSGTLMPMAASDGPHYAANIKLSGPGKYRLTCKLRPPDGKVFHRHTDKETGVAAWWAPFDLKWEFTYIGVGKKGGY